MFFFTPPQLPQLCMYCVNKIKNELFGCRVFNSPPILFEIVTVWNFVAFRLLVDATTLWFVFGVWKQAKKSFSFQMLMVTQKLLQWGLIRPRGAL